MANIGHPGLINYMIDQNMETPNILLRLDIVSQALPRCYTQAPVQINHLQKKCNKNLERY